MANKLIERPSKREQAKSRAGELKEKYTVEFNADGSRYRLIDKTTGEVADETNSGISSIEKNRFNRLVSKEMTKNDTFRSIKSRPKNILSIGGTKPTQSDSNISLMTPITKTTNISTNLAPVRVIKPEPEPLSALDDFKMKLDEVEEELTDRKVPKNTISFILYNLKNDPEKVLNYLKNEDRDEGTKVLIDTYKLPDSNVFTKTSVNPLESRWKEIGDLFSNGKPVYSPYTIEPNNYIAPEPSYITEWRSKKAADRKAQLIQKLKQYDNR